MGQYVPTESGSENGLADFSKNNFNGDGKINLQWTECNKKKKNNKKWRQ